MPHNSASVTAIVACASDETGLRTFLGALPSGCGMAYVLMQAAVPGRDRRAPAFAALDTSTLQSSCRLPMIQVDRNEPLLEPDHLYVVKPERGVSLERGRLKAQAVQPA